MPYYAIYKGYKSGVYNSWDECKQYILGYSGAIFKKFKSLHEAKYFAKNGKIQKEVSILTFFDQPIITKKSDRIKVYTDGSCYRNGTKYAKAGIGVYFGKNDIRNVSRRVIGKQSNNVAELLAIIEVSKIMKDDLDKGFKIEICTDSEYSIKCATSYGSKMEAMNWSKPIPNRELVKTIYRTYNKYPNVRFKHVRSHTGEQDEDSIGNDYADKLANMALKY